MGPKDEAGTSPLSQPGAIWPEKSGILSTLEHDLGGGMDGHVSGSISSLRGCSWRSEKIHPYIGPLLLGPMVVLLVLRVTYKEASFKELTFTFKIHFRHLTLMKRVLKD